MISTGINGPSKCKWPIYNNSLLNAKAKGKSIKEFLVVHKALLQSVAALGGLLTAIFGIIIPQFYFSIAAEDFDINEPLELCRGELQNLNLSIDGGLGLKLLAATPIGKISLKPTAPPGVKVNIPETPDLGDPLFHSNISIYVDENASENSGKVVIKGIGPLGIVKEQEINLKIIENKYFKLVIKDPQRKIQKNTTIEVQIHVLRGSDYLKEIYLNNSSLPRGIKSEFVPANLQPYETQSMMRIRAGQEAEDGNYNFTVYGKGMDNKIDSCNLSLVIEPYKCFNILLNTPTINIKKGGKASLLIDLIGINNYTGKVNLRILNSPNDITPNVQKPVIYLSPTSHKNQSTLEIQASDNAVPENWYNLTINGLGEDGSSINKTIMVSIDKEDGYFEIKPKYENVDLKAGETINSMIEIEGINGYEGTVNLRVGNLPGGVTTDISPPNGLYINNPHNIKDFNLVIKADSDLKSDIRFDMIITGTDEKGNSKDSKIGISIQVEDLPENATSPIIELSSNADPHAERDGDDDVKNINPTVIAPERYNPGDPFLGKVASNEFNYDRMPISKNTRLQGGWYRSQNNPDSANYSTDFERRNLDMTYENNDYTITLVLDSSSKPIDVIFIKDSRVISREEMPKEIEDQAWDKLQIYSR